jgi:hypothetical protein
MQHRTSKSVHIPSLIQSGKQEFVLNDSDFPALPKSASVEKSHETPTTQCKTADIQSDANKKTDATLSDFDLDDSFIVNPLNDEDADCVGLREFIAQANAKARKQTAWEAYEAAMSFF